MELETLREIEKNLRVLSKELMKLKDRRVLYVWAEYYSALNVKERHLKWNVKVTGNISSADITVETSDGRIIQVQVKTGKWQRYEFGSEVMYSADASFGKGTQIKKKRFDYLVLIITDDAEIKETLVFSLDELKEVGPRPSLAGYPKTNPCLLSRVESIEAYEKWIMFHKITDPIYRIEHDICEHPENYVDRWDKIH